MLQAPIGRYAGLLDPTRRLLYRRPPALLSLFHALSRLTHHLPHRLPASPLWRSSNSPGSSQSLNSAGVTLLELIIVIALVGSLVVYLASNLLGVGDSAKEDQSYIAMSQIGQSLQMYRVHNNRLPTAEQGLQALVQNPGVPSWRGPYIETNKLIDPWGNPFSYEAASPRQFKIISPGIDGALGTEDDVTYPKPAQTSGEGSGATQGY